MAENPYAHLIDFIREQNVKTAPWLLGTVKSVSPLIIILNQRELYAKELLVSWPLLHSSQQEERLQAGDTVSLFPADDWQSFVVMSKVVQP